MIQSFWPAEVLPDPNNDLDEVSKILELYYGLNMQTMIFALKLSIIYCVTALMAVNYYSQVFANILIQEIWFGQLKKPEPIRRISSTLKMSNIIQITN